MSLISIDDIYLLIGLVVAILVILTLKDKQHPKRLTTALFWGLFGSLFLFGDLAVDTLGAKLAHQIAGAMVIGIALLAGMGWVSLGSYQETSPAQKAASAERLGNRIFLPALLIPLLTVAATLLLAGVSVGDVLLLDPKHQTLAALALACGIALLVGWRLTGDNPLKAVAESRRLVDSIGWAAILPQMLAMLGGVFVVAQTGDSIKALVSLFVDPNNRFGLVVIYCVGMALFTMIMGNAFAAFPVMTAGIALPFLIEGQGASPAPLMAIGMYSGYCGTLMTPMAANFNIVPAALLDLDDKYQVIKVQIPTALALLTTNIFLMYFIVFD
ncbi:DUF979 domain-containing protein [Shewanella khirikhana]|uniref:DUF979 domain-containing protein n=1 Tax=Shewanella khirikhana TaxID=1965282 RepID=A0ABM7DSP1_9GAMM|nr:DUF979 domain-containing protein [Shewanella khirikhana]AZQ12726.1 hypothetical protein STH12_03671 [Shewanella khirikhana]